MSVPVQEKVPESTVVNYITRGRKDKLEGWVDQGVVDINVRLSDGRTLLHLAAQNGHSDIVRYLLSKGANKESRDFAGNLPIQVTTNERCLKYLARPGIGNSEICVERAKDALALKDPSRALELAEKAVAEFSGNAEAFAVKGHCLMALGRLSEADSAYEQSSMLDRTKAEPLWCRAHIAQSNLDMYIARLDQILISFPGDKTALFNKAIALMQLKKVLDALPILDDLIEMDPDNWAAWGHKGLICFSVGDITRAYACLTRTLELKPNQQPFAQALEDVKQTIGDRSSQLRRRAQQALAEAITLQRSWKWESSIPLFEEALKISPNDDRGWAGKGLSLARLRRENEALVCLQRAVSLNPQSPAVNELRLIKRTQLLREKEANANFVKDQSDRMAEVRSRIENSKKMLGIIELEQTRASIRQQRDKIAESKKQFELKIAASTRVKIVYRKVTKAFHLGPSLMDELRSRFHIGEKAQILFKQEDITTTDGFSVVPTESVLSSENGTLFNKLFVSTN